MTSYDLNRLTQPAPASKPVPAPKPPVPVQREPREGVSGYFYKEVFWSLSIDERNAKMLRVNRDLALKMEWENITAAMRAPKEVLTPLSESEKAKAFAPPTQRPQNRVFATARDWRGVQRSSTLQLITQRLSDAHRRRAGIVHLHALGGCLPLVVRT
jgi:hypothetical protein